MSAIDQFKDAQIDMLRETVTEFAMKIDALEAHLRDREAHIEFLLRRIRNLEEEIADAARA